MLSCTNVDLKGDCQLWISKQINKTLDYLLSQMKGPHLDQKKKKKK